MKRLLLLGLMGAALAGCSDDTEVSASCMANLRCGAEAFKQQAELLCRPRISEMVGANLRWVRKRELELISSYAWKDKEKGIIAYYGHKAEIQTSSGDYVQLNYECDVDPNNKSKPVVGVQIQAK